MGSELKIVKKDHADFQMRPRISMRVSPSAPSVRPSVQMSVCMSVRKSVRYHFCKTAEKGQERVRRETLWSYTDP